MLWQRRDIDRQETHWVSVELHGLSRLIEHHPESFVCGNQDISATALKAVKTVFDLSIQSELVSKSRINKLISSLEPSHAPQTRSTMESKGKQEYAKGLTPPVETPKTMFEITPLSSLFVEGMTEDQVWAQLELKTNTICNILDFALKIGDGEGEEVDEGATTLQDVHLEAALKELANGDEADLNVSDQGEGEGEVYYHPFLDKIARDRYGGAADELKEEVAYIQDPPSSLISDDDDRESDCARTIVSSQKKRHRRDVLDDGFFDLVLFNAETEQAEAISSSSGRLDGLEETDDEDVSIDLFAAVQNESIEEDDSRGAVYRDFFELPASATKTRLNDASNIRTTHGKVRFLDEVRVKEIRSSERSFEFSTEDGCVEEDTDLDEEGDTGGLINTGPNVPTTSSDAGGLDDIHGNEKERRVMKRLEEDLFREDEDSLQEDRSTHEKRLTLLQGQITELEAANVGPKDWVLMGEADSRMRPQNSLLEEDLEFERVMKTVPIITEEIVHNLEERIKARIIEGRFDDVVRVRSDDDRAFLPSRFLELTDKKSMQSLAQIYENEFTASQGGSSMGEDHDGKRHKEHNEIEVLWENICCKLDALCNAHFMPKQAKGTILTISNVSTAILESAIPTSKSATDMFAPEEVFMPMSDGPRTRSELTPSEKRTLRSKTRKERKRSRDTLNHSVDKYAKVTSIGGLKRQKKIALESVVKTGRGVTVVGKMKNLLGKKDPKTVRRPKQ